MNEEKERGTKRLKIHSQKVNGTFKESERRWVQSHCFSVLEVWGQFATKHF